MNSSFYVNINIIFYIMLSQLTLEVINKLYISAVSHPGGTKQGSLRKSHLKICLGVDQ